MNTAEHSLTDDSAVAVAVERLIARLRGEEWYAFSIEATTRLDYTIWIWDGLHMWFAGSLTPFKGRTPSTVDIVGLHDTLKFIRVGP